MSAGLWTSSHTDQEPHPQVASYPPGMLSSFIFSEKMLVCENQFCIPNNKQVSHWKVRLVLLFALSGWWQAIFSLASFHSGLDQTSNYKKCISAELWCHMSNLVMVIAWYTFLTSYWWRAIEYFDFKFISWCHSKFNNKIVLLMIVYHVHNLTAMPKPIGWFWQLLSLC